MSAATDTRSNLRAGPPPIEDLLLEIVRAGPAHNQLLSPLTPYTALCGGDGPVDLRLPFEQAQLLTRLDRLRDAAHGAAVTDAPRDAELAELGGAVARLLAPVPALAAALRAPPAPADRLLHIRLRSSAQELGLVPFEATLVPGEVTGVGAAPLLLQPHPPTVLTREIRRRQALPVDWNRPPRILFAFASPAGLPPVPAQDHVDALRRAIDPWIGIRATAAERLVDVRRMLTVLKNASIRTIAAACREGDYTHVHLLAHGAPLPGSDGLRRFGICLAADGDGTDGGPIGAAPAAGDLRPPAEVVDGQRLALALTGFGTGGDGRRPMPPPTVVSLATCDSGNVGSVLAPGGSLAHELHVQGVPWVVASQFPLGMRASTLLAESLYAGLLAGDDPRWVLHRVRQRLRLELPATHDWASLVAYASLAADLPAQLDAFRSRQTKSRLDVRFARMDALVVGARSTAADREAAAAELVRLGDQVRADLAAWCDEPVARGDPRVRAARLAMRAASEKRIGILHGSRTGDDPAARQQSDDAYRLARRHYRAAFKAEPASHWALTQYLSLLALPALSPTAADLQAAADRHRRWWQAAWQLADWDAASATTARARAWAHGTLAELELLGVVYTGDERSAADRRAAVVEQCRRVCEACEAGATAAAEDRFPVASTLRQFRRYLDHWPRPEWNELAQAAVAVLQGCD